MTIPASTGSHGLALLTPEEAADMLRVSVRTLRRQHAAGLKWVKVGKQLRYRADDISEWIDSRVSGGYACRSGGQGARTTITIAPSRSPGSVIGFEEAQARARRLKPGK